MSNFNNNPMSRHYQRDFEPPDMQPGLMRRPDREGVAKGYDARPLSNVAANCLGNTVTLAPFSSGALIKNMHGGDDGEFLTLAFGISPVIASNIAPDAVDDYFVQGTASWGAGGATQTASFDIQNGTQIRIAGSTYDVSATYTPANTIHPEITRSSLLITTMVGYGSVTVAGATGSQAQYTVRLPTLATGATSDPIAVPNFANAMTVYSSIPAGDITIQMWSRLGPSASITPNVSARTLTDNPSNVRMYALPQGTSIITLTNNVAILSLAPTIVFSLNL